MKLPEIYSLPDEEYFRALETDDRLVTPELMNKFNKIVKKSEKPTEVEFIRTTFPLDLRFTSSFSNVFIQGCNACSSAIQMSDLRILSRLLFNKNKHLLWIQSIAHWVSLVALLLIVPWGRDEWYTCLVFFSLYLIFIFYEIVVMFNNGKMYMKDLYNWVDLPLYVIGISLALYSIIQGREFLTDSYWNFVTMLYFAMLIFRSITMLRVMDGSRYMIEMIVASFKDMRYFLLIITSFILGIGTLRIILRIPDEEFEGSFEELWRVSDMIYNWGYGNWDDSSDMKWSIYILYLFTSIFLALVMMNMLIALISQTFERYTENREREDIKQMLRVLSEINSFLRFFYTPATTRQDRSYFQIIKVKYDDEISNQQINERIDEVNERIEKIDERIEKIDERIEKIIESNKQIIESNKQSNKQINEVKKDILEAINKLLEDRAKS